MIEINGISASPGIVIGKVLLFLDDNLNLPEYAIAETDLENEINRLDIAVEKSKRELEEIKMALQKAANSFDQISFVDAHLMMLQDPEFLSQVKATLKTELKNVETCLFQTSRKMISVLEATGDEYLKERTIDIFDVTKRILSNLLLKKRVTLQDLTEPVVVVGRNLLPSDTLSMNKRMVQAIAMEMGGKTSHTAILARSFEIPAVLGLADLPSLAKNGDTIIVDGYLGKVILNPNKEILQEYQEKTKVYQKREVELLSLNALPAESLDGKSITLKANIEVVDEIDSALAYGADGVGLFRSEFLLMKPGIANDEEAQYQEYRKVVEGMNGKPVTIRTLDIGGDKSIPHIYNVSEENPILGCRSIRFCLTAPELFKIQLRAILRASNHGNVQVMFPMISGIGELEQTLTLFQEAKEELKATGRSFKNDIPVGVMIEVPSAALTSDILAKKVDFFSIGTNDLIQYTVAVDRGNEKVAYLYNSFHLSVIRLIKLVVENAHNNHIPVSMCGEMAGDPLSTVLLMGLGLDSFSMTSFSIPEVKQIIRSISIREAEDFVDRVMEIPSAKEIEAFVRKWMNERFKFFGV